VNGALPAIAAIGNPELLRCRSLGLFCSIKCPGDVILRTYELIASVREAGIPMIGGFHSPMEKECLNLLLRGSPRSLTVAAKQSEVIVCPARAIDGMRLPGTWKKPLADGRLLVLSAFDKKQRRTTGEMSLMRNLFVCGVERPDSDCSCRRRQ
jgi:hypothetical protein